MRVHSKVVRFASGYRSNFMQTLDLLRRCLELISSSRPQTQDAICVRSHTVDVAIRPEYKSVSVAASNLADL